MSQSSNVPKIAVSKLFRGRNQGSELLIGREKELADLDAAWNGVGKKNVVTIVAWGGIGKTSFVAHWAAKKLAQPEHSGIEHYFDWSFYSQGTRRESDTTGASHAASADLFLKEALEFFGDPLLAASNAGAWQKGERLAQLVGQRRTLLVLDGLEPLQDARTGELRDGGLRALLRGLAAHNFGLCLVTTRQHLPDLNTWYQTTAPEWVLARLSEEAGAALLTELGVDGTDLEKRDLSDRVKGHALTITLLGRYLRRAHHGDIHRVDCVDFQKVNEKEQGGHAFRVIAAYERWFDNNHCAAELAILRMLGLFDRPATPDCLAALRKRPIPGLTDTITSLTEGDWNEAVNHLVELNLVEERPWEPCRIFGYDKEEARTVEQGGELGEPKLFEIPHLTLGIRHSLDAHPLIREFFSKRLQENAKIWKTTNARLFEHLKTSVPFWPEDLGGLQPLFQAVVHGCRAGLETKALVEIYVKRVMRSDSFHAARKLGAIGFLVDILSCFFLGVGWVRPVTRNSLYRQGLNPARQYFVSMEAVIYLASSKGYASSEAREAMETAHRLGRNSAEKFRPLVGLWSHHLVRGELAKATILAAALSDICPEKPIARSSARMATGLTLFYKAEFSRSALELEKGISEYKSATRVQALHDLRMGNDPSVVCQAFRAFALWILGHPDQAINNCDKALAMAKEINHPFSIALAMYMAAQLEQLCDGSYQNVENRAKALVDYCRIQGSTFFQTHGDVIRSWARFQLEESADAANDMRQAIYRHVQTGGYLAEPFYNIQLSEIYNQLGDLDQARICLDTAREQMLAQRQGRWESELYRVNALIEWNANKCGFETCHGLLVKSTKIAQRQGAKALELRTAIELAKIFDAQGKRREAFETLTAACSLFDRNSKTKDVRRAFALLDKWSVEIENQ